MPDVELDVRVCEMDNGLPSKDSSSPVVLWVSDGEGWIEVGVPDVELDVVTGEIVGDGLFCNNSASLSALCDDAEE